MTAKKSAITSTVNAAAGRVTNNPVIIPAEIFATSPKNIFPAKTSKRLAKMPKTVTEISPIVFFIIRVPRYICGR